MSWKPFWFESQYWLGSVVRSRQEWSRIVAVHEEKDPGGLFWLLNARQSTRSKLDIPRFGFDSVSSEYAGMRLRDWAREQGMDLGEG